jgi:hypothetical protein
MPWRGPRDLDIYGWHFIPGARAPHEDRMFAFSPEVGRSITWDRKSPGNGTPDPAQVNALLARIEQFGRGEIHITRYELTTAKDNTPVGIKWMDFVARLSWPASSEPR